MNNLKPDAFEQLFLSRKKRILAIIRRYSKSREDTEDIAQEVAIRLFRNIAKLKNPDAFDAWLTIITVRECARYFAEARADADSIEELLANDELSFLIETDAEYLPYENAVRNEFLSGIRSEVDGMPKLVQQILTLHFALGMGYRKIAERLDIPTGTVSSYLFRARKLLREAISRP